MTHVQPDPRNRQPAQKWQFAVLAIFRNEAHVLDEWLRHYFTWGAEHVYLINNNSTDDFMSIVEPYIAAGSVSLFCCEKDGYQIGAYTELLPLLTRECEWIGVFDLDEFIYSTDGSQIGLTLQRYADYEAILIPWLSFGSNAQLTQPDSVVDGFIRRGAAEVSKSFLKAISRPGQIVYFSQHNPHTRNSNKILANGVPIGDDSYMHLMEENVQDFVLINNHYRLQSREYFTSVKTGRPEVHEDVKDRRKKASFFDENDIHWNKVSDTRLADLRLAKAGTLQ